MTKTIETNKTPPRSNTLNVPTLLLAIMLLLSALVGILNATLIAVGIVICFALLFLLGKLPLAFPFVLFYNSLYGMALGVSISRIYTILILINFLLQWKGKATFRAKYALPLSVYAIFLVAVMLPLSFSYAYLFLDIVCCLILVSVFAKSSEMLKSFFRVYSLVCLVSYITGTVIQNTIGGEYDYSRFMATFEDPNYMGFFFTLGIFALVTLRLFDKRLRVVIVIALYIMLLTSLSITAIVVNIVLWLFYLVIMKKLRWWSLFVIAFVAFLAVWIFNYGMSNPDAPVFGALAARIDEKMASLFAGDWGNFTTGRFNLAQAHFEYYKNLPFLRLLFGGIPVNVRYVYPAFSAAAHNEFVDLLLNVGFLGAIAMIGFFISTLIGHVKKYRKEKDPQSLCLIMCKAAWLCYAMSLTVFLDFRFMFMFLI